MKNITIMLSEIRTEYITSDTSYKKLADKYGVSVNHLKNIGKDEKWVEQKKKYIAETAKEAIEVIKKVKIDKLVKLVTSADRMAAVIEKCLDDENQFYRYVYNYKYKDKNGIEKLKVEQRILKKIDSKALFEMTSTIRELASVIRDLNNINTEAELERRDLARAKFELEKKKADEGNNDKEIIIKMEVPEEYTQ